LVIVTGNTGLAASLRVFAPAPRAHIPLPLMLSVLGWPAEFERHLHPSTPREV
jgi:hypothetical protein